MPRTLVLALVLFTSLAGAGELENLAARLEQERVKHKIPGMAFAVVRDDRIVLARGFGLRDVEKGLPVEPDTPFAVGSTTKAFTTAEERAPLLGRHRVPTLRVEARVLEKDGRLAIDVPEQTTYVLKWPGCASFRLNARKCMSPPSSCPVYFFDILPKAGAARRHGVSLAVRREEAL